MFIAHCINIILGRFRASGRHLLNYALCLSFLVSCVGVYPVYATDGTCDTIFFQNNDIINYNPCATSCSSAATSSASLGTGEQQQKIWNWLTSKGMSEQGAAGIMGNMQVESGFNPFRLQVAGETYESLVNSDGYNKAFGLVQWDGSRRVAVLNVIGSTESNKQYVSTNYGKLATDYKKAPSEINDIFLTTELDYMYKESTPGGSRPNTWKLMLEADSPTAAADKFEEVFEGSVRGAGGAHSAAATQIYNKFKGTASSAVDTAVATSSASSCGGSAVDTSISEGGLTEDQAKKLVINYGTNTGGDSEKTVGTAYWNACNGGGSNCVTFSRFFMNKFTKEKGSNPMGNGEAVVANNTARGIPSGNTPKPFAVFSWSKGTYGHTGVVLGIHGDTIIVGHASCSNPGRGPGDGYSWNSGSAIIRVGKASDPSVWLGTMPTGFSYPTVDINAIQDYLGGGVTINA